MEATDIAKSTGYVMADEAWREIVFIAARTVLYRRRSPLSDVALLPYPGSEEIVLKARGHILLDVDAVVRRIGLDVEKLRRVMVAAASAGYFGDKPRLAPFDVPEAELRAAATHLGEFNGHGDWSVTYESLRGFAEQFPPEHRNQLIGLVRSFNVLNRAALVAAIRAQILGLAKAPGQKGFIVGLSPDSGNAVRIWLEHELRAPLDTSGWTFKKTIRDALSEAEDTAELVLCDDNVTSGSQATCQFLAWLGVPEAGWTEEQRREQGIERAQLSRRDQDLLKVLSTTIISAVGTENARQTLSQRLPALGMTRFRGLHYANEMSRDVANLEDLADYLEDVGTHLLAWVRHGQENPANLSAGELDACRRDALGYNGARALICTPMNVPVGTITAFWCPGMYRGNPWMPLVLRRSYLKNLILA
jgi:hypothetical protein